MIRKLTLAVGIGTGYVLGARAGRDRYEQIVLKAKELAGQPKVQDLTSKATATASELADKAKDKTNDAVGAAKDKVSSAGDDTPSTPAGATAPTLGDASLAGGVAGGASFADDAYTTDAYATDTYATDPVVDPLDDPAAAVVDLDPDTTGTGTGPMPGAGPSLSEPDVLR